MVARKTRLSPSGGCAALVLVLALQSGAVLAGAQRYEPLSASVQAQMQRAIADQAAPRLAFDDPFAGASWLKAMSKRLERLIPDQSDRLELLTTIHYEATRAGLDPQMVLGLIHVESRFRKFAVSHAGARGYMQVMPFWVDAIGAESHNLFNLRTNLRYGCTILRHYLDIERGDVFRALGRYNGTLGKAGYPQRVHRAWMQTWRYERDPLAGRSPAPAAARSQRSAGQG
jgi:soluble lytic murein transglycosylase-like protein